MKAKSNSATRLIIGTAQFGMSYGVANRAGQTSICEAAKILRLAQSSGVWLIDTATSYGDSERRLGEIGIGGWGVISKSPLVPDSAGDIGRWLIDLVESSLARLKIPRLRGFLLHRPEQLLGSSGALLYAALQQLKIANLVEKIGVSIYDPGELDRLCSLYRFDIVQCPFNVADRRLIDSGWLYRLRDQGTELHVRSIFLQGLLLLSPQARPAKFSEWDGLWSSWRQWLEQAAVTPLQACLNYVLAFPEIAHIVLGVEEAAQLQDILGAMGHSVPAVPRTLQCKDLRLIDPSRWNDL